MFLRSRTGLGLIIVILGVIKKFYRDGLTYHAADNVVTEEDITWSELTSVLTLPSYQSHRELQLSHSGPHLVRMSPARKLDPKLQARMPRSVPHYLFPLHVWTEPDQSLVWLIISKHVR